MEITALEGKDVRISKTSITCLDSNGKTCGVVRGLRKYQDLAPRVRFDLHQDKALTEAGLWYTTDHIMFDGKAIYLLASTSEMDNLKKLSTDPRLTEFTRNDRACYNALTKIYSNLETVTNVTVIWCNRIYGLSPEARDWEGIAEALNAEDVLATETATTTEDTTTTEDATTTTEDATENTTAAEADETKGEHIMKNPSIDIAWFAKHYQMNSDWLYDRNEHGNQISEFKSLVDSYESFIAIPPHKQFVDEFCSYTKSRIGNDIDAAAFMRTIEDAKVYMLKFTYGDEEESNVTEYIESLKARIAELETALEEATTTATETTTEAAVAETADETKGEHIMKKHNIDIAAFAKRYRENYDWLYNGGDQISEYDDLVKSFDAFASTHQEFITEFVNYIGDLISSDREAAAFMLTLTDMTNEEGNTMETTTEITECEQLTITETADETATLKARIAELEEENARIKAKAAETETECNREYARWLETNGKNADQITDLKAKLAHEKKTVELQAARIAELEAAEPTDQASYLEHLETQIADLEAQVSTLQTELDRRRHDEASQIEWTNGLIAERKQDAARIAELEHIVECQEHEKRNAEAIMEERGKYTEALEAKVRTLKDRLKEARAAAKTETATETIPSPTEKPAISTTIGKGCTATVSAAGNLIMETRYLNLDDTPVETTTETPAAVTETKPETPATETALNMGTTIDEAEAALKALDGVDVTVKGRKTAMPVIWISGSTKQHKETLKAAGCKWSAKKSAWWYKTAAC